MKCYTIEGHEVVRNGIELENGYLTLGELGQGREEHSIRFKETEIKIMDEYYKKIYQFYRPDGRFICNAYEYEVDEKRFELIKILGFENLIEKAKLNRYVRMVEYLEGEQNDMLIYFKRPEKINSRVFEFKDGEKYEIILKGICAEGKKGRDGKWEEYLIHIKEDGWVKFKLKRKESVIYPIYHNIKARICCIEEFERRKRIK